jgi:hypothetical protein
VHILKQLVDPENPLVDSIQLFMDTNNDLIAQIHDEKDPGAVEQFQLVDFDGYVTIPVGNQAIDLLSGHFFKSTPNQNATWTTSSARQGWLVWIHVDNSAGKTITFGTGFTDVSSISDTGIVNKILYYDGATWREIELGGGSLPTLSQYYIYVGNSSNEPAESNKITVGSDITITLGDSSGSNKLIIKDSGGNTVATINSDGGIVSYAEIGYNAVYDNGNSGSSKTIDWTKGNKQKITTTGSCTLTFTAPTKPCSLQLIIIHESSATEYSYTYPAAVKWTYKSKFNTTNASGAVDIVSFLYDGTNYYAMGNANFGT